jgi:hypothetical protein
MELIDFNKQCNNCCDSKLRIEACSNNTPVVIYLDESTGTPVITYAILSTGTITTIAPANLLIGNCTDIANSSSIPEVVQGAGSPVVGSTAPTGSKLYFDTISGKLTRANIGGFWVSVADDTLNITGTSLTGNTIATLTDEAGVITTIKETITSLGTPTLSLANILTIPYTDETGTTISRTVDLSTLALDINVQSFSLNTTTGVLTLTETDGTVHTVDFFAATPTNGLQVIAPDSIGLGGNLTQPTTITSSTTNPLNFATSDNGKVATFQGDIDVQGQIDPNSIVFSDGLTTTYNAATQNGYKIGVNTGATQRPIFIQPLTDSSRTFEVRDISNNVIQSTDTLTKRLGLLTNNPNTTLDVNGDFSVEFGNDLSGTSGQNNISTDGVSTLRLTGISTASYSGFANGKSGKFLYLHNTSAVTHVILNNNVGSSVGNRIITGTGADFQLLAGTACMLQYDSTNQVWRMLSGGGAGSKKFRVTQALVAGNNTITHNLQLTDTSVIVEVRNSITGAIITHRVITEAANTTVINVTAAVASARITIIG